jgi:hypothetical protein
LSISTGGSPVSTCIIALNDEAFWRGKVCFGARKSPKFPAITRQKVGKVLMMLRLLKSILLGFSVGIVGLVISLFTLSLEENSGLGLLFKLRGEKHPPSDVVVVSIDKESSDQLGISENPDKEWGTSIKL